MKISDESFFRRVNFEPENADFASKRNSNLRQISNIEL